jgi:two-component system sensor histidine kinase HydH
VEKDAMRFRGRLAWWGLGLGVATGVADVALGLRLGMDFRIADRDVTAFVAAFLATGYAALGFAVGHLVDARARARRDAETIRRQMRELEESQRVAAQNEKLAALGELAAGVAHEVRNPLGVIRASAAMVQESFDPGEEPYRACRFICEETDRLNGLITSLLGFARPTRPRPQLLSMEKVLDRALQLGGPDLERRRVEVERRVHPGIPQLAADPDLLAQMVLGLLTNAAEALGSGGRVELRVEPRPAGEGLVLDVADSGPGVSLEDAGRIFDPFYTTKDTGTGLGLAMAARIVQTHGGHIEVIQGAGAGPGGRGACFRVQLPVGSLSGGEGS